MDNFWTDGTDPLMHEIYRNACDIGEKLRRCGKIITFAESCTGGLLAALITEIPGSSEIFHCGFVVYANKAKAKMLNIDPKLIESRGAVSRAVAVAMAEGALERSQSDLALSITGIAGPGGASPAKPVGLVHIALAGTGLTTRHSRFVFASDGRQKIRLKSIEKGLNIIKANIKGLPLRSEK